MERGRQDGVNGQMRGWPGAWAVYYRRIRGRSEDVSVRVTWREESLPRAVDSGLIISPALGTKGEKHEVNLISLF